MTKNEQLIDAIGSVDVKYIDEFIAAKIENKIKKHKRPWKKIAEIAACFMLIVSGALFINFPLHNRSLNTKSTNGPILGDDIAGYLSPSQDQDSNPETVTAVAKRYVPTGKVIDSYTSNSAACYIPPNAGKYFCFIEVNDALKKYADQNVTYFLAIDIFADNKALNNSNDELNIELQRLNNLGYHVGYAMYWEYQGKEEQVSKFRVAGFFTKEELDSFCVNKTYGYAFSFMLNGDRSPVSSQQGIITDYDLIVE